MDHFLSILSVHPPLPLLIHATLSCFCASRMLALMAPRESWVAQWQNQSSLEPGMYAVAVAGVEAADGRGDDEDDVDMDEDV